MFGNNYGMNQSNFSGGGFGTNPQMNPMNPMMNQMNTMSPQMGPMMGQGMYPMGNAQFGNQGIPPNLNYSTQRNPMGNFSGLGYGGMGMNNMGMSNMGMGMGMGNMSGMGGYGNMNNSFNSAMMPSYNPGQFQMDYQNTANMANSNFYQMLQMDKYKVERRNEQDDFLYHTKLIRKGLKYGTDEIDEDEDEKQDEENEDEKKRYQFRNVKYKEIKPYIPRSDFFYDRDRYFIEQMIMKPLKTNGIFGRKIVEDFDKTKLFDEEFQELIKSSFVNIKVDDEEEYFEKSIKDGIYLDYVKQLLYSYNIQKIEQRVAREGNKGWFLPNGNLRMDNDIFNDVITKPVNISLTPNDRFNIFYGNSLFSGRNSVAKMRSFKLKIIISKLTFIYHPSFNEEEILCSEMKELHRDFYKTMNELNIPYLKNKIQIISQRLEEYSRLKELNDSMQVEVKNMRIFLNESIDFLSSEKKKLNDKANRLYNKWLELKNLRKTQGYQCSRAKLNVIRFNSNPQNENIFDYAFIITNSDISGDPSKLEKQETSRRDSIKKNDVSLKFFINGIFAFETKANPISWPNFEVEYNSEYILKLYTRPTKMEIEVYINKKFVGRYDAEPPGIFANTVTSSSELYEFIEFGSPEEEEAKRKKELQKKKEEEEKAKNVQKIDIGNNNNNDNENESLINNKKDQEDEEEKKKMEIEEEERKKKLESMQNNDENDDNKPIINKDGIQGKILIKTEWFDKYGPDLPPTKIENKLDLVNRQIEFKEFIRKYNEWDYPFDVNDPRNVAFIDEMKKGRLELMLKFLYKEYLLNFYDAVSTRHYLLVKRIEKQSLKKKTFPVLEIQIERDQATKDILKELKEEDMRMKYENEDEQYNYQVMEGLEKIKKKYSGRVLTDDEFYQMLKEKQRILRRDVCHQSQYCYNNIITEAEIIAEPLQFIKEFLIRLCTYERKLAPIRKNPPPVKVENVTKIKINIHVIKAANVPVRFGNFPSNIINHMKLQSVGFSSGNVVLQNYKGNMVNINNQYNMGNPYGNMSQNASFNMGMGMPGMGTMGLNPSMNPMYNPNQNMPAYYNTSGFANRGLDTIVKVRDLSALKTVNSFVEVKIIYYDQVSIFRTDSVESVHPDYNYHIEFDIKPNKGKKYFSRDELSSCPGVFYFTLYDEVKRETFIKGKDTNTFIQKFEKKYLGSFTIPFSTVFQNASVLDTVVKVNIPKAVFGYYSDTTNIQDITQQYLNFDKEKEMEAAANERKNKSFNVSGSLNIMPNFQEQQQEVIQDIPKIVNPFLNTYVSLYISLDPVPNFTKSEEFDYIPGYEDSIFLINATKWLKDKKEKQLFKNRYIKLFAENFDGFSVYLPRFIKKEGQRPPSDILNSSDLSAIDIVARYVSLIPFIDDNQTFNDKDEEMPDCWCTDYQFFTLGYGDYEEHAILLCNYFNYIDQQTKSGCKSYLVLGDAHPEGMTTYVMRATEDFKQIELWNAKTADCYYMSKEIEENKFLCITVNEQFKRVSSNILSICQLKSVGALIDSENVYINKQKESDPTLMFFDIHDKKNWEPFLTENAIKKYFPKGVTTVQTDIYYSEPSEKERDMLKEEITKYIKQNVEKERADISNNSEGISSYQTNWQQVDTEKIEKELEKYEMLSFNMAKSGINLRKRFQGDFEKVFQEEKNKITDDLEGFEREIKEIYPNSDIYGFPINIAYTTMREIWEQIKLTSVHLIGEADSTLSLTVYVNPLPGNINSIWVFFAIIKG